MNFGNNLEINANLRLEPTASLRLTRDVRDHDMGKTATILGISVLALLLGGRVWRFFEGVNFEKSWAALITVPLLLLTFLGFFAFSLAMLISVIRKRTSPKWLAALLFPVLWYYSYYVPVPTFVDGMKFKMSRSFKPSVFYDFSHEARSSFHGEGFKFYKGDELMNLQQKFPEIMNLGLPPSVKVDNSYVEILWGSALVKHWGIRISNDHSIEPFESSEKATYREVFEGIYAYHVPY